MEVQTIIKVLKQVIIFMAQTAGTELAKGVKDAYTKLKLWLCAKDTESEEILIKLEQKPESHGYAITLSEKIEELDFTSDEEFIDLFKKLVNEIEKTQLPVPEISVVNVQSAEGEVDIENDQLKGRALYDGIKGDKGVKIKNVQGKKI